MTYQCEICNYLYEESNQIPFTDLPDDWVCPICRAKKQQMHPLTIEEPQPMQIKEEPILDGSLDYPEELARTISEYEEQMDMIQRMSLTGETVVEPMKTKKPLIGWDDILLLGAQLSTMPLDDDAVVNTKTIIGKRAKQPMELESPIIISHMSFGALSKEAKVALAKGAAFAKTAICGGEGGLLPEEFEASHRYIFEYIPNLYSVNDENLKKVDAIEIKIGQGAKPGMGGQLPGDKVTDEIAKIRGKEIGKDIISPSHFTDIKSKDDLKALVDELRLRSEGRPVGVKIAAGHIEKDMEWIAYSGADFMTIDGRGGGTGAAPKILKDATTVPTLFALYRADKYRKEHKLDLDLIITGGLRISSDFAKAIALGADVVAIATAAMMSLGCMQYRVCDKGNCPMGIATQDPELRSRLNVESAGIRVGNFLNAATDELRTFARITGKSDIHALSINDLATTNSEISKHTAIAHV